MFRRCGMPEFIQQAFDGYSATVIAYGQTGSGKTFTMSGITERQQRQSAVRLHDARGLMPRSLSIIAEECKKFNERHGPGTCKLRASYVEIYNETLQDLLNPGGSNLSTREKLDRELGTKSFFVEGLMLVSCWSEADLQAVATEGHRNRHVRSHQLNADSSRSHSLMTVYVETTLSGYGVLFSPSFDCIFF